jgi:hypothetical protein
VKQWGFSKKNTPLGGDKYIKGMARIQEVSAYVVNPLSIGGCG